MIEVIVVLAIISILSVLSLVALQSAREAARSGSCRNNLRQIGLAIHQYITSYGVMPLAWNEGNGQSFLIGILPFVDQASLYNSLNISLPIPLTVQHYQLKIYQCPSDYPNVAPPVGWTNYAGNRGSGVLAFGYNGVFGLMDSVSLQSISDGMSTTAAVSEWLVGMESGGMRDRRRSVFTTPSRLSGSDQLDAFAASCRGLDPEVAQLSPAVVGVPWTHGDFGHSLYDHVVEINGNSCLNGTMWQEGAWTVKSNHGSGAHLMFADGSVKFIKSSVNIETWRALGSRDGGEIIDSNSF